MNYVSVLIQHHAGPTGDVLLVKNQNGVWGFPEGCVRTNETEAEACERIAWETLGMKVVAGNLLVQGRKYPQDGTVEHILCGNITHNTHSKDNYHSYYAAVNKWAVEPKGETYTEYKWVHTADLSSYEYEGDDANFMAKYGPWVGGRFIPNVRML